MAKFIENLMKRVERNFLVGDVRMQGHLSGFGFLGINAQDKLRDFQGGEKGWEAPPDKKADFLKNAVGMIQQTFDEPFAAGLRQYKHLEAAQKMLAESPTGKALMDSSEKGHVLTRLDVQMNFRGGYYPDYRILALNPAAMSIENGAESFKASMTHVLGHEHFHAFQQRTEISQAGPSGYVGDEYGGAGFTFTDPRDDILKNMHNEAAAHAVQIQVAYELKDKYPAVLNDIKSDEAMAPVVEAFEAEVKKNPQSLQNGKALSAAHNEWLNPESSRFATYQGDAIARWEHGLRVIEKKLGAMHPERAAQTVSMIGSGRIDAKDMKRVGVQPNGINHMDLPDSVSPTSPKYKDAFLPAFEKDLKGIYDRMDGLRQKFTPDTPGLSSPAIKTAMTVTAPRISAPKMGGGKMGM